MISNNIAGWSRVCKLLHGNLRRSGSTQTVSTEVLEIIEGLLIVVVRVPQRKSGVERSRAVTRGSEKLSPLPMARVEPKLKRQLLSFGDERLQKVAVGREVCRRPSAVGGRILLDVKPQRAPSFRRRNANGLPKLRGRIRVADAREEVDVAVGDASGSGVVEVDFGGVVGGAVGVPGANDGELVASGLEACPGARRVGKIQVDADDGVGGAADLDVLRGQVVLGVDFGSAEEAT